LFVSLPSCGLKDGTINIPFNIRRAQAKNKIVPFLWCFIKNKNKKVKTQILNSIRVRFNGGRPKIAEN